MALNERELLVVATRVMRFTEKEALAYMKGHNHEMSAASYYRILTHIEGETRKRLFQIAKSMKERHLERIDELAKIKKEMWKQYHKEEKPYLKTRILKEIKELQPYISAYDEATKSILEESVKKFANAENICIPSFGE